MNSEMEALLIEREIAHQYARMVRIYDKRDWGALGDVFASEVEFDYADGDKQSGLAALKSKLISFLENCGPTQHMTGALLVEYAGNGVAVSRAYVRAMHQGRGELSHLFCNMFGEFHDEWKLKSDGWRIVKRRAVAGLIQGDMQALGSATLNLKL